MSLKSIFNEFKSTFKILLPLNIASLVIAVAGKLILILSGDNPITILISVIKFVQFLFTVAVLVVLIAPFVTAFNSVSPFYKDNNLKISRPSLNSTLICSLVWLIIGAIVATFSYLIFYGKYPFYIGLIFDGNLALEIITIALLLLLAFFIICQEYLSVAIGNLFIKNQLPISLITLVIELGFSTALIYLLFYSDISQNIFSFIPRKIYDFILGYGILFALVIILLAITCFEVSVKLLKKQSSSLSADNIIE